MLDRSRSRDRSKTGGAFSPAGLFVTGAQGAWYDPSDFSTLYQDSAGTTPVTAVEQPVGLMLDRSRGLVLGGELVTNGGFDSNLTGWTNSSAGTGTVIASGGGAVVTTVDGSNYGLFTQNLSVTAGVMYRLVFTVSGNTASNIYIGGANSFGAGLPGGNPPNLSGTNTIFAVATSGTLTVSFQTAGNAVGTFTIDNVSVRELPGTHAVQATSASRPVLRARYNLVLQSENLQLNWGALLGATITSATTLTVTTTFGSGFESNLPIVFPAGTTVTGSVVLSGSGTVEVGIVDMSGAFSGTFVTVPLTSTPTRYSVTRTLADANFVLRVRNVSGAAVTDLTATQMQVLTAADEASTGGAYQHIAAATDYDVSNPVFRPYLAFDGVDDILETSAIDMTATDKLSMFAGVTKLIDDAARAVASFGGTSSGSAEMFAPRASNQQYAFSHRTNVAQETVDFTGPAPDTSILTGLSDIGAPSVQLRRNGVVVATNTSALNAANYGNYTLRIGARESGNIHFNGRLYSLAVLGRTATAAELSAMEAWVAGKTGATLA